MEITISHITDYMDFLISDQHMNVALHGDIVCHEELVKYNIHISPYCQYIKVDCHSYGTCVLKQQEVMKRCEDGSFFGICYAGVGEFAYPVRYQGKIIGYISVSGYKNTGSEIGEAKLKYFAEKKGLDYEKLERMRQQMLKTEMPEKRQIDTLLHPLVLMLEAFCGEYYTEKGTETELLSYEVFKYVMNHYTRRITMQELSNEFHYSISALSHMFKRKCGMSLNAYIEHLRLDKAKLLLRNSDLSVIDISYTLGFCSSNYFSSVFRKNYQVSPREYRQQNRKGGNDT